MELLLIYSIFVFALGAVVASFLNVVIYRVPLGQSIVRPASHCPKCNAPIRWYQNIPIISWLCLRGKCASCTEPISVRYLMVEVLGGVLFVLTFWEFGLWGAIYWIWISLMIVGSFIDIDHHLLPDFVTIGGIIFGLVVNGLFSLYDGTFYPILFSIGGLALGFGLLGLVRYVGGLVFKREAMGMGDVILLGAIGAIFGPIAALFVLIVSSILGSLAGIAMVLISKIRLGRFVEIPFGPYLCLATLIWMFRGPYLVSQYLSLFK